MSSEGTQTTIYRDGQPVGHYENSQQPVTTTRRARAQESSPRLPGPKLKIERAIRHVEELEALATSFSGRNPYQLTHNIDPKTGENVFRILVKEAIPREAGAIVGDAIHNIRCALDYLVCDLARANDVAPHQNGGFPIEARAKRSKPGSIPKIRGVSSTAEKLILRAKACDRLNEPLFALHMLDVFDKHNAIVAVAAATLKISAKIGVPGFFVSPGGVACLGGGGQPLMIDAGSPSRFKLICPLENNMEVHRSAAGFDEEVEASIEIAFGPFGVIEIEGEPIIPTLRGFIDLVDWMVNLFARRCLA